MTVSPTACDAGPGLLGDVRDPRVDARAGAAVAGAGSAAVEDVLDGEVDVNALGLAARKVLAWTERPCIPVGIQL